MDKFCAIFLNKKACQACVGHIPGVSNTWTAKCLEPDTSGHRNMHGRSRCLEGVPVAVLETGRKNVLNRNLAGTPDSRCLQTHQTPENSKCLRSGCGVLS